MTTLTIKDLARTEALDRKSLAAVRGGMGRSFPSYCWPSYPSHPSYGGKHDNSLTATQTIGQNQEVFNANGNNVFGADGITSKVKPVQTASNSIVA